MIPTAKLHIFPVSPKFFCPFCIIAPKFKTQFYRIAPKFKTQFYRIAPKFSRNKLPSPVPWFGADACAIYCTSE